MGSLACLRFPPDFVVFEPLIESPVAFDWGADGKLWVVEMRDYPSGANGGRVVVLEDINGDGVYNKSSGFLDGLSYPNGICPWHNGVIVSAGLRALAAR